MIELNVLTPLNDGEYGLNDEFLCVRLRFDAAGLGLNNAELERRFIQEARVDSIEDYDFEGEDDDS